MSIEVGIPDEFGDYTGIGNYGEGQVADPDDGQSGRIEYGLEEEEVAEHAKRTAALRFDGPGRDIGSGARHQHLGDDFEEESEQHQPEQRFEEADGEPIGRGRRVPFRAKCRGDDDTAIKRVADHDHEPQEPEAEEREGRPHAEEVDPGGARGVAGWHRISCSAGESTRRYFRGSEAALSWEN